MGSKKTAWHPPFLGHLYEHSPRWARVRGEVQLTVEPLRVDAVLEVWADRVHDASDVGTTLRGLWRYLVVVCLLEYKSKVWPFQHGDLYRLFVYGMLWLADHQQRAREGGGRGERLARHEVTMALAVPSVNQALRDELTEFDLALPASETGYYHVVGAPLTLVVIDLGVVAEQENDDLLRWFAGQPMRTLEAKRWVRQHQYAKDGAMSTQATEDLEGYDEYMEEMLRQATPQQKLRGMTPEERVAGLRPEERVAGLRPEERVAGLRPEEVVAVLPVEVLRALSDEYLATLSPETQAKIRAARGH